MRYLTIILLFLATFATGQQAMFLRSTPAPSGTTGILDSYTGAAAAYATALLYSDYAGACLRVRRGDNNSEADIGFSGQDIDEAAINSFCSGANCFVVTWYDQSGSGNNATQATPGDQAKIYDSSTGILRANSTALITAINSDYMTISTPLSANASGGWWVFEVTYSSNDTRIALSGAVSKAPYTPLKTTAGGTAFIMNKPNVATKPSAISFAGQGLFSSNSTSNGWKNGTDIGYGAPFGFATNNDFSTIGRYEGFYSQLNSGWQLIVYFSSDQSANRTAIESAINNYFNIY